MLYAIEKGRSCTPEQELECFSRTKSCIIYNDFWKIVFQTDHCCGQQGMAAAT